MKPDQVYDSLQRISPISEEAWNNFQGLMEPLSLKRNEYLVSEGSRVKYAYILLDGVIRVFYNKEGNEYNKTFFIPGMFPTPLTALLSGTPSALSYQALLPCELIRFSFQDFRNLFEEHRSLETFMLRVLEQEWITKERHDIQMVTNDATENYMVFRKEFPNLENQIHLYHIASYLGITPTQLSRIRAQTVQID
jgi:CRP-like cAMP-binding protein